MTQTLIELLTADCNVAMQYELVLMLGAFLAAALCIKSQSGVRAAWGAVFVFFIYIHRILLPFFISGIYLLLILSAGTALISLSPKAALLPFKYLRTKLLFYTERKRLVYTVVILMVLLIQLCRINICIDYDSIRYGLRSDVLLTGGEGIRGFFTNTGLVNNVYTYPKGFELLTLPMYFGGTYGNILCINIWMLIGIILIVGEMVRAVIDSEQAECMAAMLTALIPGITNMSITAKSDLITLLCQLVFIYCVLRFAASAGKAENAYSGTLTGLGTAALILSYSFKPTAFIFSSFTGLAALIYIAAKRWRLSISGTGIRALLASLLFTGIITLRTWLITGFPVTGVFSGVFESLGLKLNYPFRSMSLLDGADGLGFKDKLVQLAKRIFGVLICPAGDDMSHVFMCWGGLVCIIMLMVLVCFSRGLKQRARELASLKEIKNEGVRVSDSALAFLRYIWAAAAVMSVIALYFLYQVDGNYFMLFYSLTAAAGTAVYAVAAGYELSSAKIPGTRRIFSQSYRAAGALLAVVMVYFTAFTGWCGAVGFTEIDPVNRGFYAHSTEYDYAPIWSNDSRVVAFAYEPDCYRLNGRVESWVDIDGSGGNVYLTDTKLDIFKEYLSFADIDYIYADMDFLLDTENSRHVRANTLFNYLLEDGCFTDIYLLENSTNQVVAELDKERLAVSWEVPMGDERSERTARQTEWFAGIQ